LGRAEGEEPLTRRNKADKSEEQRGKKREDPTPVEDMALAREEGENWKQKEIGSAGWSGGVVL